MEAHYDGYHFHPYGTVMFNPFSVKEYDREFQNYLLAFPNEEVKYGFINFLVPFYTSVTNSDQNFYIVSSEERNIAHWLCE